MSRPWDVLTIGHSTRSLESFVALLKSAGATGVVDVRTVPRSRHNPQFNRDVLPATLATAQLAYIHIPGLGGLRRPVEDSVNGGWRNASFRGFADYMQTEAFAVALDELVAMAASTTPALMCAEAVPWRCHRSLIADALLARGFAVGHIMGGPSVRAHVLTPFAHIEGPRVWYPPSEDTAVSGQP
jgi:uncharacterized protein (DUF488 family)